MKVPGNAGGWTHEDFQDVVIALGAVGEGEVGIDRPTFASALFAADGTIVLSFCDGDLGVLRRPDSHLVLEHTDEDDVS